MEPNDQDEGGGLTKKVATGVAVGLATAGAAGVAKKLLSNGDEDDSGEGGTDAERGSKSRSGS